MIAMANSIGVGLNRSEADENQAVIGEELVRLLVFEGGINQVLRECALADVIRKRANNHGMNATTSEIQARADACRRSLGLTEAEQTVRFLQRFDLDVDDLEEYNETHVLREKLQEELFDEGFLRTVFERNRELLQAFRLLMIEHEDKVKLQRVKEYIIQDRSSFRKCVQQYSTHESRYRRGELGLRYRHQLGYTLSQEIVEDSEGNLVGPLKKAGRFRLFKVEEVLQPEWNKRLKDHLRNNLFKAWLKEGLLLEKLR